MKFKPGDRIRFKKTLTLADWKNIHIDEVPIDYETVYILSEDSCFYGCRDGQSIKSFTLVGDQAGYLYTINLFNKVMGVSRRTVTEKLP